MPLQARLDAQALRIISWCAGSISQLSLKMIKIGRGSLSGSVKTLSTGYKGKTKAKKQMDKYSLQSYHLLIKQL